ncbi:MAG: ABC transporter permease [Planctomycetes bacterium]|nr:ABC transporter permease [Planctomycetota bacterium]
MYRLFLALRYIWSRPISWVSMVGIWLSVMALIATIAIMSGFLRETRAMIRGTTSDLILTPRAGLAGRAFLRPAPPFAAIKEAALEVAGVRGLSPHLVRPALIRVPDFSSEVMGNRKYAEMNFVQVVGLDPLQEQDATDFNSYVRKAPQNGDPPADPACPFSVDSRLVPREYRNADLPVVLVGDELFGFYELEKGQVISLVTLPEASGGEIKPLSQRFIVGGSLRTGHYQHDRTTVYVELQAAREFAEAEGDASEICLAAEPGADLEELRDRLARRFGEEGLNVGVETWMDRNAKFLGAVENERSILGVLLFFFVLVACFNVFATLTIMVSDKTKDIGVLNAMGATARGLLEIFVGCGVIMTLLSATLGCVSGVLVALNINHVNDGLEWLFGVRIFRADIYTFSEIPVEISAWFVAIVFLATLVLAIVFALVPALRAARMDPVRALRYE